MKHVIANQRQCPVALRNKDKLFATQGDGFLELQDLAVMILCGLC